MQTFVRIVLGVMLASGCYVDGPPPAAVLAADDGQLVEISPGVEVVVDYDAPIFFADDYYWWFNDGVWFWSPWYRGGWTRAPHVPRYVAGIPHPEHYAHYRPVRSASWNGMARQAPRGGGRRR